MAVREARAEAGGSPWREGFVEVSAERRTFRPEGPHLFATVDLTEMRVLDEGRAPRGREW